jgi:hypothetical protein
MIVVGQMYHFELRKIATQPLREPWRNLPERKAVMESDEKLHEDSVEFSVSSFKLKTGKYTHHPSASLRAGCGTERTEKDQVRDCNFHKS